MEGRSDTQKRLARLLDEVAVNEGLSRSLVEGVELARISRPSPRAPMVYQPNIIILGQGRKRAYLGGEVYSYDAFNYLTLSVPIPADCETMASPEEPLLLVAINVLPAMLGEMLLEMDEPLPSVGPTPRGISTSPMSEELAGSVIRLLECLKSPLDSRMLGRQTVREIVYRVLCGEQGNSLRALASRDDHFARIARVLKFLHSDYARAAQRRRDGPTVRHEPRGLPPSLQARDGQFAAPVPQANSSRPCEATDGSRRLQRRDRRQGGRLREFVAVQPGVQAPLRHDSRRRGRTDEGPTRRQLIRLAIPPTSGSSWLDRQFGRSGPGDPGFLGPTSPVQESGEGFI